MCRFVACVFVEMTKLLQWLTFLFAFVAVWISILFDYLPLQFDAPSKEVIWMVCTYDMVSTTSIWLNAVKF